MTARSNDNPIRGACAACGEVLVSPERWIEVDAYCFCGDNCIIDWLKAYTKLLDGMIRYGHKT